MVLRGRAIIGVIKGSSGRGETISAEHGCEPASGLALRPLDWVKRLFLDQVPKRSGRRDVSITGQVQRDIVAVGSSCPRRGGHPKVGVGPCRVFRKGSYFGPAP